MPKDEPGGRTGTWSAALPDGTKQIDREIEQLTHELDRARAAEDKSFLSVSESGTLITIGVLGLLGSAWVTARLLQQALPPTLVAHTDFLAGTLRAIQKGLGVRGAAVAGIVGWLLLALLGGLGLWEHLGDKVRRRVRPLAVAWIVGIVLVTLPFYEFQTGSAPQTSRLVADATGTAPQDGFALRAGVAPVSIALGLVIVLGIYTVVALLQPSHSLTGFFNWLDENWFGAFVAIGTLGLILTGVMIHSPNTLLVGILLASCLSLKALLLGIQKLTKARQVDSLVAQLSALHAQRARDEERRWVLSELDCFINPGTPQPV